MNPYLIFILLIIIVTYVMELVLSFLNLRSLDPDLPNEFRDTYDIEKYKVSQKYTAITTKFSMIKETIITPLTIGFILFGGFNWVDQIARGFDQNNIVSGIIFIILVALISTVISLPFSIYSTFVIEEKFGFNKTTQKTFILDLIKTVLLSLIIGIPVLFFILWFFETGGKLAWLYSWVAMVFFIIIFQFLGPVLIMPLFNKFTPLPDGELKDNIVDYVKKQKFTIKGIYTMDGSKRSTKLNAFFTGLGKSRRIVFFDTLLEKLHDSEVLAVLAHEMGHYKLKHIIKMTLASIIHMGLVFYILSFFLNNEGLSQAFGMKQTSIYASLIFFGFLYSPISTLLSILFNILSRKHEYEADRFAAVTTNNPYHLISGLKKLSKLNLSNLTPHPWIVFVTYSHPPVLERIKKLRRI